MILYHILFVCTGNTCRSPMAEALLKQKNHPNIAVKSAGTFAENGNTASINTITVLKETGFELTHTSSILTEQLVSWATHIITMTTAHKHQVIDRFPFVVGKVTTLKQLAENTDEDVHDPYGGSLQTYRTTRAEILRLIDTITNKF